MSPRDERKLQERARKLYDGAEGNPRRLAMLAAQFQAAVAEQDAGRTSAALFVVGLVSHQSGEPRVEMTWGGERGQLDVDEAREFARNVQEACTNAAADAALLAWARDDLKLDLDRSAALIDAFRRYRHDRWGQPDVVAEFEAPAPEGDDA